MYLYQSASLRNENEIALNGITFVHNFACAMFVFCGPRFATSLHRWLRLSEKHWPLATLSNCRCETKMMPSRFRKYAKVCAHSHIRQTQLNEHVAQAHTHQTLSSKQTNHIHCYYCLNSLHTQLMQAYACMHVSAKRFMHFTKYTVYFQLRTPHEHAWVLAGTRTGAIQISFKHI